MPSRPLHVVVGGHSNLTYTESSPDRSATALLQARLSEELPDRECTVVAAEAPLLRGLTERAVAAVEEERPDFVVITFLGSAFAFDFVTNRVRRRWRRAYALALKLADSLKGLAGDVTDVGGARSQVFHIPEAVAFRLFGGEPFITVDRAASQAIGTVERLLRFEDTEIICRLPGITAGLGGRGVLHYDQRVNAFNSAVAGYCDSRLVSWFRVDDALNQLGGHPHYAADGAHLDFETRRLEATATAERIKAVVLASAAVGGKVPGQTR
jgi:hypothetical protein